MNSFFSSNGWRAFLLFFALFAKSLWLFYYYCLYGIKKIKYTRKFKGKTALIVPTYNESPERLIDTINHAKRARGLDEIIFIDDGSDSDEVSNVLNKHCKGKCKKVILPWNVGKRKAQFEGVQKASKDVDVFVFMDSDTILQRNSVLELTKPMINKEIGGVTGCILVKNKDDNFLTKMLSAMYWSASNIWREAPSKLGFVQVTNGQLSCYRASIIRDILPKYVSQKFMGQECTLSDDRYLTHHIQTDYKKRIIYQKSAVVYTYVPNTFRSVYKMFLRWKRGSWRESILVLKRANKHPLLVADIWANHAVQIMQAIVRIGIIIIAIFITPNILLYYLIVISIISLLFGFHMIVENTRELGYRILYSIFSEIYFSWSYLHALLTIHRQGKWITR